MTTIYILKLISGTEIMTSLTLTNDNLDVFEQNLVLSKPLAFGNVDTGDINNPRLAFFPYNISNVMCPKIILNGKNIESYITETYIDESLKKEYLEKTSTIALI